MSGRWRAPRSAAALAKRALSPLVQRIVPQRKDLPPGLWNLSRTRSGALGLFGVELAPLLQQWGSPLHVVDAARLAENVARFRARPGGAAAGCEVYYSYKTNPVAGVLRRLHALGLGAEVVSAYELWLALRLGVSPSAIVYNGPVKSKESVRDAIANGIGLFNVNARSEIAQVAAIARELSKRPRMGVRVCVPGGWSGQFGERVDTGAALAAFREALAVPDLRVVALHAHLGGEIASMERLHRFVGAVLAFTDELRKTFGLELEILDFGGSLACPTVAPRSERDLRLAGAFASDVPSRAPRSVLSIDDYVAHIVGSVGDHYRARGRPAPRIFLEPGRAMTANAQMLLCTVMQVRDPDPQGITWAVLDAGINVAESVRSEFHQLFAIGAPRAGARPRVYRLTGPTCTPGDVLFRAWHLPELVTGDALAIMDSGAYFVPYSTSFSYPQPGIAMVEDGQAWLLRRKETYEDLIARDVALQGDAAAGTGT